MNNNHGRLQDLILFYKIPMGTRKNFFETDKQFGHTPSKSFANPDLESLHLIVVGLCVLITLRAIPVVPGRPSTLD